MEKERGPYYRLTQTQSQNTNVDSSALPPISFRPVAPAAVTPSQPHVFRPTIAQPAEPAVLPFMRQIIAEQDPARLARSDAAAAQQAPRPAVTAPSRPPVTRPVQAVRPARPVAPQVVEQLQPVYARPLSGTPSACPAASRPMAHPAGGPIAQPVAAAQPTLIIKKKKRIAPAQQAVMSAPAPNSDAPSLFAPLDLSLPGALPHRTLKSRNTSGRKKFARAAAAVFAVVILAGGAFGAKAYANLHKAFKGGAPTVAALAKPAEKVDPNALNGEGSGRINILIMGKGGAGHPGGELTDTMLVASIDPVNKKAALLSVPRDLWVLPTDAKSPMKINAVYNTAKLAALKANKQDTAGAEKAGTSAAEQMVSTVLGVPINYYAMIDFTAFKQAIDAVGGVTINVPEELLDPTMAWENNNSPILASPGMQVMDGKKALNYVRSRETSSDFARSQRQRAVIESLEQKIMSAGTLTNPAALDQLMQTFGSHVTTDLSIANAQRLGGILKNIPSDKVSSISLADAPTVYVRTDRVGLQSVVRPVAGYNSYDDIHNFIRNQLRDGYLAKENAGIMIVNGSTTDAEAALRKAAELKSYGYNVVGTATTTKEYKQTQLVDLSKDTAKYTRNYLEERLDTKAVTSLSDNSIATHGAQFVIIVGNNDATKSTTTP